MFPSKRSLSLTAALLAAISAAAAQTPPAAYTVQMVNAMMGTPVTMNIQRDGSMAVIEMNDSRTFYDLTGHTTWSLSVAHPESGCGIGKWGGDWGDPFKLDLGGQKLTPAGNETVNGVAANIVTAGAPPNVIKAWIEPKTGLIVKAMLGDKTMIEVKKFTPGKPAGSLTPPPACIAQKAPQTAEEHIAEITGDSAANYSRANYPPASPNACTVVVRAVKQGTMEYFKTFQIAVDLASTSAHPNAHTTGVGEHYTFAGGEVKELTAQMRNGALRIPNAPAEFYLEAAFGNNGSADSGVYRQCSAPETVLLLVIKNPARLSDGVEWLWVKSGKYASAN